MDEGDDLKSFWLLKARGFDTLTRDLSGHNPDGKEAVSKAASNRKRREGSNPSVRGIPILHSDNASALKQTHTPC